MTTPHNNWSDYQKLVMYRLDEHSKKLDSIENSVTALKVKVAAIGGAMGLVGGFLFHLMKG